MTQVISHEFCTKFKNTFLKNTPARMLMDIKFFSRSFLHAFRKYLELFEKGKNKTSSRRLEKDIGFTTSWRRLICVVLKTSNLRRLDNVWFATSSDVWFTTSWRCPIYVVLKTSNLRLKDVWFMMSWRRL